MKRFRRHKRSRAPTFWLRNCRTNLLIVSASHTSVGCDSWPVLALDELAIGNPDFGAEDKMFTTRRIRLTGGFTWTTNLTGSTIAREWQIYCVLAKCAIGQLGTFGSGVPLTLGGVLNGGDVQSPNAMDVLGVHSWMWSTAEYMRGDAPVAVSTVRPFDIDVKASRRLDASECIAAFWFMDQIPAGTSLPSAASFSVITEFVTSTLYSPSPRR